MTSKNVILSTLKRIGLGENEATLYQILLENPKASIAELTKKSPFSRTMLYYIIENLDGLGLLITHNGQRHKTYEAGNPQKLQQIVLEKETEIRQQKKMITDVMPDLQSTFRLALNKPNIRFFEGKKGIREALKERFNAPSKEYISIVDMDAVYKYIPKINEDAYKKNKRLGFTSRSLITNSEFSKKRLLAGKKAEEIDPKVVRLAPDNFTSRQTVLQVYENKVAYYSIRENNKMAVIIEDPDISALHRDVFEALWELGKPIKE